MKFRLHLFAILIAFSPSTFSAERAQLSHIKVIGSSTVFESPAVTPAGKIVGIVFEENEISERIESILNKEAEAPYIIRKKPFGYQLIELGEIERADFELTLPDGSFLPINDVLIQCSCGKARVAMLTDQNLIHTMAVNELFENGFESAMEYISSWHRKNKETDPRLPTFLLIYKEEVLLQATEDEFGSQFGVIGSCGTKIHTELSIEFGI